MTVSFERHAAASDPVHLRIEQNITYEMPYHSARRRLLVLNRTSRGRHVNISACSNPPSRRIQQVLPGRMVERGIRPPIHYARRLRGTPRRQKPLISER